MTSEHTNDRNANHELITTYVNAWEAADAPTLVGLYHDDIVLHWFGENPLAGDHVGKPAALQALFKLGQLTNRKVKVHDILSGPGHAAILAHETWQRDGQTMEVNRVLVFHLRDGLLAECWVYDEDQRAVDTFWS